MFIIYKIPYLLPYQQEGQILSNSYHTFINEFLTAEIHCLEFCNFDQNIIRIISVAILFRHIQVARFQTKSLQSPST